MPAVASPIIMEGDVMLPPLLLPGIHLLLPLLHLAGPPPRLPV
jgi:hypothetical protein